MEAKKTFSGDDIRRIRAEFGFTQEQLGSRFSPPLSPTTISGWESGRFQVPVSRSLEIARFCNLTPETCAALGIRAPKLPPAASREVRTVEDVETGSDVRALRIQMRLKQQELADLLGISKNVLSQWESRKEGKLPATALPAIARAFKGETQPPIAGHSQDEQAITQKDLRARIVFNINKLTAAQLAAVDAFIEGAVARAIEQ